MENNIGTEEAIRQKLGGTVGGYGWRKLMNNLFRSESTFGIVYAKPVYLSIYAEGKARRHNLQDVTPGVIRDEISWVLGWNK